MRRRQFLATAGLGVLAGCAGGGDGGTSIAPATETDGGSGESSGTTDPGTARTDRPHRGVSLSPRSYEGEDFASFFELAREAGSLVRWAGDWVELEAADGAPAAVATLARRHGLEPVVETGVFSVGERELFRPLTPAARERFVETVAAFCEEHEPPYLGLGVEVDVHYEADPDSFGTFVDLFAEAYDAVGAVSPGTSVYAGFQLERLRGLRGGLFGGENDPESANWDLLDRFPEADLTAVTSYPGLIYGDPADVPDDSYAALADRTDRPVAITETGWSAESKGEEWASDEAEQAAFVRRLGSLTAGIDLATLVWLWLYEQPEETGPFSGMSLRRDDGSPRPAWEAWVSGR